MSDPTPITADSPFDFLINEPGRRRESCADAGPRGGSTHGFPLHGADRWPVERKWHHHGPL